MCVQCCMHRDGSLSHLCANRDHESQKERVLRCESENFTAIWLKLPFLKVLWESGRSTVLHFLIDNVMQWAQLTPNHYSNGFWWSFLEKKIARWIDRYRLYMCIQIIFLGEKKKKASVAYWNKITCC